MSAPTVPASWASLLTATILVAMLMVAISLWRLSSCISATTRASTVPLPLSLKST